MANRPPVENTGVAAPREADDEPNTIRLCVDQSYPNIGILPEQERKSAQELLGHAQNTQLSSTVLRHVGQLTRKMMISSRGPALSLDGGNHARSLGFSPIGLGGKTSE